jgi:hypothetical protein
MMLKIPAVAIPRALRTAKLYVTLFIVFLRPGLAESAAVNSMLRQAKKKADTWSAFI